MHADRVRRNREVAPVDRPHHTLAQHAQDTHAGLRYVIGREGWTGWQALESDGRSPADADSADGGGRGRTDPLWVGTSDAVEARVAAGATALPAGLRLDLINPDETRRFRIYERFTVRIKVPQALVLLRFK